MGRKSIYKNGKIFTADRERPFADSMIVEDKKILWIGNEADLIELGDESLDIIDLNNKRVIPGFVDAHMHPVTLADYNRQISCLPPKVNSIEELKRAIRNRRQKQRPGDWILGWGYDEGKFEEKRSPNRYDLDEGCDDAPVCLTRTCLHIRCVNSKVLQMAGITRETPDPEGGKIDRDENGEPTGILCENARFLVNDLLPVNSFEDNVENVLQLGDVLSSQGITSITDMGIFDDSNPKQIYEEAFRRGLKQRVGIYYPINFFKAQGAEEAFCAKGGMETEGQVQIKGLKLFGDGSVSGKTAWMNEPYPDTDGYCGMGNTTDEELEEAISFCKKHRCQLSMHAMGGRAIDRIVKRVAKEKCWTDENIKCLRVEHITEPSEESIELARDKNFGFVIQPIFQYCEIESYLANLGLERTKKTYPVRTLLDAGVQVCFSTDSPATSWASPSDPFPSIKSAVTRIAYDGTDCGMDQRISIQEAIELYTREAAQMCGFDKLGQLREGYYADFLVLSEDILEIEPNRVDQVCVEQTYIGGIKEYERRQ
ncbi:MAG: amidohydrolase [Bacillota bacterium]|nr:amidohydrolase [Bacillota bacterium]